MNKITVEVASEKHIKYIGEILATIEAATKVRGTGIAKRKPEYIEQKINEGKAIIAMDGDNFVGFCYIECWDHGQFVANSGLIVKEEYRGQGGAKQIKRKAFELSRTMFPTAKIFGLTTSPAVKDINTSLGYETVPYREITADINFWKGCCSCVHYETLCRNGFESCNCLAMLLKPEKQ